VLAHVKTLALERIPQEGPHFRVVIDDHHAQAFRLRIQGSLLDH
jgi:hypothetical protein